MHNFDVMEVEPFVVQMFPSISELSEVKTNLKCPEEGCSSIFHNTSNLEMHLIKTHKKESRYLNKKDEHLEVQYFCPILGCKYHLAPGKNLAETRWFVKFKYLKQHYMKVHLAKLFDCKDCGKYFTTDKSRDQHAKFECGKKFVCSTCPFTYQSYISLLAHCKRKNHPMNMDLCRPLKLSSSGVKRSSGFGGSGLERRILPRPEVDSTSVDIAAAALSELSRKVVVKGVDKGVQTTGGGWGRRKGSSKGGAPDSRETQTTPGGQRISAETQTTAVFPGRKPRARRRGKSTETQTARPHPAQVNENTFIVPEFNITNTQSSTIAGGTLDDDIFHNFWPSTSRNSSSTQTIPQEDMVEMVLGGKGGLDLDLFTAEGDERGGSSSSDSLYTNDQIDRLIQQSTIFDETRSCDIETQTDHNCSSGSVETIPSLDDCPNLSNTETQTIRDTIDIYSNNYTQTCDDVFLNDFVEFSDIETQTAWANLTTIESALVSAETQTAL